MGMNEAIKKIKKLDNKMDSLRTLEAEDISEE